MDRSVWDWPRLVERLSDILSFDVPAVAAAFDAPINVRIRSRSRANDEQRAWDIRTFSFVQGRWFERHAGRVRVEAEAVIEHVRGLDDLKDTWAIVRFARVLGAAEVDGMSPSEAASILMRFDGIRRRLRPAVVAGTV